MPSIQVKNVPDDTWAIWRHRAAAAGQSLQEYLRGWLIQEASKPTIEEVLARAAERPGGDFTIDDVNAILRADRASH